MKAMIKEGFIFILLAAIVIFFIMIVLYDFVPAETTVDVVQYVADSNVKSTLEEVLTGVGNPDKAESLLKSYEVDSSDLKRYKNTNSYESGKENPFEELSPKMYENVVSESSRLPEVAGESSSLKGGSSLK